MYGESPFLPYTTYFVYGESLFCRTHSRLKSAPLYRPNISAVTRLMPSHSGSSTDAPPAVVRP